jgi:hypothetical protein
MDNIYFINYIKSLSFDNKYTKWYISIIENGLKRYNFDSSIKIDQNKRRARKLYGYLEFHHIVPRSLNKKFSTETKNLVPLTAKEHFLCHLLLTKMIKDSYHRSKMTFAFKRMMTGGNGNRYVSSYYSKRKLETPPANLGKIHITDGFETIYHPSDKPIPNGWYKGSGKKYKINRSLINQKNKKEVLAIDLESNIFFTIKDIKKWSKENNIPYPTIVSAIRKNHIVRKQYQFSWAEG